ncbi:MAG: DUF2273 domain-containing protein [Bacillota bacterium]
MSEQNWWYVVKEHWGKILGGLLGLIFAILVINIGFWWSVFVFLCVGIGLLIGWRLDVSKNVGRYLDRIFAPRDDQ